MGGYDLDEYDDYEDEGEEQEEEVGEYEEEEEEEDRLPTQEEMEYLELRQKLKESIRKKMKKDSSSGLNNSREKKNKMPYDNFGSFFGPSQPVIAQRVIQESKSLLENPHLAARVTKAKNVQNKDGSGGSGGSSTPAGSKPRSNERPREVDNWAKPKAKIQMLKNTRDYSFLLSDDAELPAPPKNPPKTVSAPKPEAHTSHRPPNNSGRKVINGREERKSLPTPSQTRVKADQQSQRPSSAGKLASKLPDSRKQLGRNEGSGPGRPSGQKPLPPKMQPKMPSVAANNQRVVAPSVARGSIPGVRKPLPAKAPPPTQRKPLEHKRDDRGSSKGNPIRKPVLPSRPQMKQQPAKHPSSAQQKERLQKRPARSYADDDEDEGDKAISMIRSMFRYNPNRYRGVNDDDDSDMEAGFEDIMQEEKRSARIAAKEDEEELKKIEEEERRERMRKVAKKRKLSQR